MNDTIQKAQQMLCNEHNVRFCPSPEELKIGISLNVRDDIFPINGLRHPPKDDTTGWYIWAGEELSDKVDFFIPLHVKHLTDWCPTVRKYLGLPPGWRFLFAEDYEDIWYDESLLED